MFNQGIDSSYKQKTGNDSYSSTDDEEIETQKEHVRKVHDD